MAYISSSRRNSGVPNGRKVQKKIEGPITRTLSFGYGLFDKIEKEMEGKTGVTFNMCITDILLDYFEKKESVDVKSESVKNKVKGK